MRSPFILPALLCALFTTVPAWASPVYFLVGELPGQEIHNDSYVLRLDDPAHIAHARELISLGPAAGAPIVVASIAPGVDGINRNYRAVGQPEWSWHVTEFQGFADMTIEILDGWPTYVEQDVPGWIANTNGTIGFWNYTVVEELTNVPEPSGFVLAIVAIASLLCRWRSRHVNLRISLAMKTASQA